MDKSFTHKAKISIGDHTFEFKGSREFVEQQVEKILKDCKQNMSCDAGRCEPPKNDQNAKKQPPTKVSKKLLKKTSKN